MKTVVLFNNKGGVGKTTLTFNIAHMMARLGARTVLLDYDPQCNLSALVLPEERLFGLWEAEGAGTTVARCVDDVRRGRGDVVSPVLIEVAPGLSILPGELRLGRFEQGLAEEWGRIHSTDNERALHVTTALWRLARLCAEGASADLVLLDVGPSLGALNRAALLACDHVILPLAPDLFSIQGLKNVGPTLFDWREDWTGAATRSDPRHVPPGIAARPFEPLGYIMQQHLARADRPVAAYAQWAAQIPGIFRREVLRLDPAREPCAEVTVDDDPYCLARLKHFASLVPLAQMARKPIFDLRKADGVSGGQTLSVAHAMLEFQTLARDLRRRLSI